MSTKEEKILESLYPFVESNAKKLTDKKIKLKIIETMRYHDNGQAFVATMTDKNKYFLLEIDKRAFAKFSLAQLKNIILHELAHIPDTPLVTRVSPDGKKYKVYADEHHNKVFKDACKKLKVPLKYSGSDLNKLKCWIK
jgi:predicted SprT family Zn-dependent metalloprotease